MLSNRESARRSRKRKQEHLTELEHQVGCGLHQSQINQLQRLTNVLLGLGTRWGWVLQQGCSTGCWLV
jgi:hypothetical protein